MKGGGERRRAGREKERSVKGVRRVLAWSQDQLAQVGTQPE